jgi:hypothetical protein
MRQRIFVAWFDDEHALLEATRAAREAGLPIHDTYTPYAVHGMDEAMGLGPSRLTWVCFLAGLSGLGGGIALQVYTSAVSWPLDVGGKPFNSFPAFIPVAFELTVLSAALVTVAALFLRTRLYPRLAAGGPARVTDDRFALALTAGGARWSEARAAGIAATHGAVETAFQEAAR